MRYILDFCWQKKTNSSNYTRQFIWKFNWMTPCSKLVGKLWRFYCKTVENCCIQETDKKSGKNFVGKKFSILMTEGNTPKITFFWGKMIQGPIYGSKNTIHMLVLPPRGPGVLIINLQWSSFEKSSILNNETLSNAF